MTEFNTITPTLHKAAWVESLTGEISYTQRSTFLNDAVVVRGLVAPTCLSGNDQCGDVGVDHRHACIQRNQRRRMESLTPMVVDYLSVPRCNHGVKNSFTFSTGQTIEMCVECSHAFTSTIDTLNALDEHRRAVLRGGSVAKATPGAIALHDALLKTFNLSMERGMFHKSLLWGSLSHFAGKVEELSNSYSHRVNTGGSVGTDHDGERHDSSPRDRRAKQWFEYQQTKEPNTESLCRYCGAPIYDRAGTHHCPDTDCRQRFWDEWDAGLRMELFHVAERDDLLMQLWLTLKRIGAKEMATASCRVPTLNGVHRMNTTDNNQLRPELEKIVETLIGLKQLATTTGFMTFKKQRRFLNVCFRR